MNRLCSICARGGSKGVPQKNLKLINGLPLIAYSILQAEKSGLFSHIAVSSDSEEILEAASKYATVIKIRRPEAMATDSAPKLPVIQHCFLEAEKISGVSFATAVDLDATSPLRSVQDIADCVRLIEENPEADNLVTAMPARRSPYFNLIELTPEGYVGISKSLTSTIVRRQDAPQCFDMNASIYAWSREKLVAATKVLMPKTILHTMPEERSIDIDSPLDFKIVQMLLLERQGVLL